MKLKLSFLFLLTLNFFISQTVRIISSENNSPIEGIVLINKAGEYLGKTNVNGEMEESLTKNIDLLILNHPFILTDTLFVNKIVDGKYKVKTVKEVKIPEVNIVASNKDFIVVKGYFNSFVTNNSEFNIFVDGIIEYVFDRKTGKYKTEIINEYRSFILEKKGYNVKEISSFVFDTLIEIPKVSLINSVSNLDKGFKKDYDEAKDLSRYTYSKSKFSDEDFKFLGYVFKDSSREYNITIDGENPKPNRLSSFTSTAKVLLKHKSETDFSKIVITDNFYPTEVYFRNKNELEKGVKFNRKTSRFKTKYWEQDYASLFDYLSKQFKESFKQKENQ